MAADEKNGDKQKLQGTWKLVKVDKDGKEENAKPDDRDYFDMKFDGDKMILEFKAGSTEEATYTLDPGKMPKTLDIKPLTTDKGKTILGIYDLAGDKLKLCVAEAGIKERPKEFKSKKQQVTVYYLERKKG
jgi:uncharacterized protein (TIGR03067 family)